jgi:hypothetical protein
VVVLVAQGVGEGLDRSSAREGEAVQDQQEVQVPQSQLTVVVQQREAHPAEMPPEQRSGTCGHGRQRRLIGPRRTSSPPVRDHRPETFVDREGLAVGGPLAPHPVHRFLVERVQRVDGPLPASLEHVPIDPRQADRVPRRGVGVVLEPPRRRRQRAVAPRSGWPVQHARDQTGRSVGDGHGGALLSGSSEGVIV